MGYVWFYKEFEWVLFVVADIVFIWVALPVIKVFPEFRGVLC